METRKLDLPKAQFHRTAKAGVVYLVAGSGEKHYYIRYRTPDGKQRFEKAVIPGVRMSAAKADQLRQDRARGISMPNRERREARKAEKEAVASRWDFSRLFDAYMEAKGEYPRRVTDDGNWRKHLSAVIGGKTPAELTAFDTDRIKRDMMKPRQADRKPCKSGTVKAVLEFLVRLASFGVKRNLCKGIMFAVEIPKIGTVKTEQMTDEQMTAYLKAAAMCENRVIGAVLTFELLTGIRFGEVRKLTWHDVDLQRGVVHLRDPKGGKDQFLPLNPAAVDLLDQLDRDPENPFVFQGRKGGRFGVSTAARRGREFAKTAGLPKDFRPNHGLRHSYASALASSGEVDMYVLQKLMTHKSPQMTQRYAHLRDETLRRGADVMSRIVKEAEGTGGGR